MDMCMCAAWVGGLPGLCLSISKSLVTPGHWHDEIIKLFKLLDITQRLQFSNGTEIYGIPWHHSPKQQI